MTDMQKTTQEQIRINQIMEQLNKLGGGSVKEDALVFSGNQLVIPTQYRDNLTGVVDFIHRYEKQNNTYHKATKMFLYRPYDVGVALESVLRDLFGTTGIGETKRTIFGDIDPEFVTVKTAFGQERSIPWGEINFPLFGDEATIFVTGSRDRENGHIGVVQVRAQRKHRSMVEGLFVAIEEKLRTQSIYKGKALVKPGDPAPEFLDVRKVDPNMVVYSEDVLNQLQNSIWTLVEQTPLMRQMGVPLKRAVLLEGPYGTGKSLAAFLTAQRCIENGWTFLFCKPGDDLSETMQTAKLYAPSVVFFEDIDVIGDAGDPQKVSKLLDAFDGITAKGHEVIAVLTTNHKDKIHKGMTRPGRLDDVVSINGLDQAGVEKLIRAKTPAGIELMDIDFAAVFEACKDYTPAFMSEVINKVHLEAATRTKAMPTHYVTADFVNAANAKRAHYELHTGGVEEKVRPTLDDAIKSAVRTATADVVDNVKFLDRDGDVSTLASPDYTVTKFEVNREELSNSTN